MLPKLCGTPGLGMFRQQLEQFLRQDHLGLASLKLSGMPEGIPEAGRLLEQIYIRDRR